MLTAFLREHPMRELLKGGTRRLYPPQGSWLLSGSVTGRRMKSRILPAVGNSVPP